ncbi:MAG: hypothetical protein KJ057_17960 [Phycisphaerae bacterium]|nr:hypothetical protein [Planctomycetia bacterium]MCL4720347.1 hypothetical protein [Phycisphaerae bacterium]
MPRMRRTDALDSEPVGLICPKCGCAHFRVIYLKHLPGGIVRRRRECRHCGRRFTTREYLIA